MKIVFSGHGAWYAKAGFTQLPPRCSMTFYTLNAQLLSDKFGGELDVGTLNQDPDQVVNAFGSAPDMFLMPPFNPTLNIQAPDPGSWDVWIIGGNTIPAGSKNIQVQVTAKQQGYYLSEMISWLKPCFPQTGSVELIWAACRDMRVDPWSGAANGKTIGLNQLGR